MKTALALSAFLLATPPAQAELLSNEMSCAQARAYGAAHQSISFAQSYRGHRFAPRTVYFFSSLTYPSCNGSPVLVPTRDQAGCYVGCVPQIRHPGGRSGGR